jgi:uncharacterized protein
MYVPAMEHTALIIAIFLGGIVSGFSGFAFSAVAGAILLHFFEPTAAVALMMFCSVLSQAGSITMLRRLVTWRECIPLLIGGAAAVPVATHLLTLIDPHTFRAGFGLFLVSYAAYMLARPAALRNAGTSGPVTHGALGLAGGFVGGLTAMPGAVPAIWCDLRGLSKERQRGLVQPFILGMQVLGIIALMSRGNVVQSELLAHLLIALPALAAGTLIGVGMFGRVDDKGFRVAVLILLLISGGLMIS